MTTRKHPHDESEGEAPSTSSMEQKIAELESELAEARSKYLRLAADFENYKKRVRQEQLETIQHPSAELIGRLLPVLDDLNNVLVHQPRAIDESWVKGQELRVRQMAEAPGPARWQPLGGDDARTD